jgi:uncharacterized membrane-anchored protein
MIVPAAVLAMLRCFQSGELTVRDHSLRQTLNDELHGRPVHAIQTPAFISHIAMTVTPADPDPLPLVQMLCDGWKVKRPAPAAQHHAVDFGTGLFKFERHGEFYRIVVITEQMPDEGEAIVNLPAGWIDKLPGQRLVAIHTHVFGKGARQHSAFYMEKFFGHADIAGSKVSDGAATVWTDFRIRPDGFTRILMQDHGLSPPRVGRTARRIHEIETYRMMALLALPGAREIQRELPKLDQRLSAIITEMAGGQSSANDAQLLDKLTQITREVEEHANRTSYRFSAARAYSALVFKRIEELGEERVQDFERIGVFLERRFAPAMATCAAAETRLANLAERCSRASDLLRTRVDIALENQNQQLLQSMDNRARQQLMLQETVEGLSVVAISYYVVSLVEKLLQPLSGYLAEHAGSSAMKYTKLVIVPLVVVLVWMAIRNVRKRVTRHAPPRA